MRAEASTPIGIDMKVAGKISVTAILNRILPLQSRGLATSIA